MSERSDGTTTRWRPWYRRTWTVGLLAAVVVAAAVITVVATRSGGGAGHVDGAELGSGPRWPLRGDLAADRTALAAAVAALRTSVATTDPHVLWAGTVTRTSGVTRHVLITSGAAADLRLYDVTQSADRWTAAPAGTPAPDLTRPLVPLPELTTSSGTADDSAAYLVAADVRTLSALDAPPAGPTAQVDLPLSSGVARYRRAGASAHDGCRGWIVQVTAADTTYLTPWQPSGISAAALRRTGYSPQDLAALAAGTTTTADCAKPTKDGALLSLVPSTGWLPTALTTDRGILFTTPAGRTGRLLLLPLRENAPNSHTDTALAFLPTEGGAALISNPAGAEPTNQGDGPQLAAVFHGLTPTPTVLARCGCDVATTPALRTLTHQTGATLLTAPRHTASITFLDLNGDPAAAQIVRMSD